MTRTLVRRFLKHGMLPQLAVFEAAARLGSFSRAAEELHLAQPTVSVQLKKLADTVGLPLFEQVGKRVHLTEAGLRVRAACDSLFATIADLERALGELRGLESGRLRLAVSTTGKYFTPRLLAAFLAEHPGVEVTLQIQNRQGLIDRLVRNEDDLYIFATPPEEQEIVSQAILPNPLVVFARIDHPLAGVRRIPFARFAEEPFLMREPGSCTRLAALAAFDRHGHEPKVRLELAANEAIKQAILAGLGVSILSRFTLALDSENPQLTTLDVEGFPLERHWYFVYPVGKQVSVVARAFMDLVRAEARKLILDHMGHEAQR